MPCMSKGVDVIKQIATKQTALHLFLIFLVSGSVLFTNLGSAKLWDRDEPRNAGCALEMMERGDIIVPTFNDELRYQKPVLLYWLIMSAYSVFGVTEFAARFWSAVLAIGTVLFTYGIARRLMNPLVALIAAISLSTSIMFVVAGRAATPDSVLIFFSTLSMLIYVLGTFKAKTKPSDPPQLRHAKCYFPKNWFVVASMYAVMGMGILAKGPVALVIPTAIIGMFLLIQRLPQLEEKTLQSYGWLVSTFIKTIRVFHPWHFLKTCWSMRPITAIVMSALVAAPWFVLVGLQTEGDFLRIFFLQENFGRATTAFENHSGGFWYYPLMILIGFFPWSVFIGPTLLGIDRRLSNKDQWTPVYILMLCWIGVQVGVFTLVSTKLPSYITPCYPALAMLTAAFLYRLSRNQKWTAGIWYKLSIINLAIVGVALAGGLGFVTFKFLPDHSWLPAIGAVLLLGAIACWLFLAKQQFGKVVIASATMATMFCIGIFGFGTVAVDSLQSNEQVLKPVRDDDQFDAVASYQVLESSWVFYSRRPIFELARTDSQSSKNDREKFWKPKPRFTPEDFLARNPNAAFITTNEHLADLRSQLPIDYQVANETPFFLKDKTLVLLTRKTTRTANSNSTIR